MKTAKEFFQEELSGEPLTEESVIEGLELFAKQLLEEYTNRIIENAKVIQDDYIFSSNPKCSAKVDKKSITNQLPLMLKKLGYE